MAGRELAKLNEDQKLALWAERVADCRNSDLTVAAWCKENHVSIQTYYKWQRRIFELAKKQYDAQFVEVNIPNQTLSPSSVATLRVNDVSLDIYSGIDAATLETLCRVIRLC